MLFERATGYKVISVASDLLVLANERGVERAWFSQDDQLAAILDKCNIDLVLDVGANQGQFGSALRKSFKGRILSFEPIASVYTLLKQTAAHDPNWHVHNVALGSQDTQKTIHISAQSVFSSFLNTNEFCERRFGAGATGAREEVVSVRRLDTLLPELVPDIDKSRIFLKMDTQGYDLEVFGGLGHLRERVAALQTEVSVIPIYKDMPPWTDSIRCFEEAGFGVAGLFPIHREALRVIEYDCVMINVRTPAAS